MGSRAKFASLVVCIPSVLSLLTLTGCGIDTDDTHPYSMTIWQTMGPKFNELLKDPISHVEDDLPGLSVNVRFMDPRVVQDRLVKSIDRGTSPDIIIGSLDLLPSLASKRMISWLDSIRKNYKDSYPTGTWDMVTYGHHQYALPLSVGTVALAYNKDIVPVPPRNTKSLLLKVSELSGAGKIGLAGDFSDPSYTFPFYADLSRSVDPRTEYTRIVTDLSWAGGFFNTNPTHSEESAIGAFEREEAAMCLVSQRAFWSLSRSQVNAGIIPLPKIPGVIGNPSPIIKGNIIMVGAYSEDKYLSGKVARLITQSNYLTGYFNIAKQLPAAKCLYKRPPFDTPLGKGFLQTLMGRLSYTYDIRSGRILDILKQDLAGSLTGPIIEGPESTMGVQQELNTTQ